jgi:hypothetical protein
MQHVIGHLGAAVEASRERRKAWASALSSPVNMGKAARSASSGARRLAMLSEVALCNSTMLATAAGWADRYLLKSCRYST